MIDKKLFTSEEVALLKELHNPRRVNIDEDEIIKRLRKEDNWRRKYTFVPHAYWKMDGSRILECDVEYTVFSKKGRKYIGNYTIRGGLKRA